MKITRKTRYITNGKVYIKLGFYSPGSHPEKKHSGQFYMCTDYPKDAAAHYLGGPRNGRVFESWVRGKDGYMQKFIGISKKLIPDRILKALDK